MDQNNGLLESDEIDLVAAIQKVWGRRRFILIITVISAFINGLVGNFIRQGFNDYDIHMFTVLRFTVGDILGTLVVLLVCTIMLSVYMDIINKSNKTN